MAIIVKASTAGTTNLSATAAWVGGVLPVGADIAVWDASSLTGTQTLAASPTWGAIRGDAIAGNLTINPSGANRILTLQGYLDGGEEFLVDMSSATSGRIVLFDGASGFTSTVQVGASATVGIIDVASGASFAAFQYILGSRPIKKRGTGFFSLGLLNTTTTAFTSPIELEAGAIFVGAQGETLANYATGTGTLTARAGVTLATGNAAVSTIRYFSNPIVVDGDITLGTGGAGAAGTTGFRYGDFQLGATTKTLTVAGNTRIDSAITGTAGFTKAGAGDLTLTNTGNTISGAITIGSGIAASNLYFGTFVSGTGSANVVPNITSLSVAARVWYNHYVGGASTFNNSITFTEGGAGFLGISGASTWSGAGIVFSAGQLVGLGPATPAGNRGLLLFTNESFRNSLITVNDFPTSVTFSSGAVTAATMNQTIAVASGAAGGTYATKFFIDGGPNVANTWTTKIAANQTAAPLVFQGGVERLTSASAQTTTFRVGGTNTQDNTISGPISEISGKAIAVAKEDAGRWILSNTANSFTGGVSISAGTLVASGSGTGTNFGSSTTGAVTQTGGTIDISGGITLNKGTVAANTVGVSGSTALTSTSGNNEWIIGAIAMNSTTIVDIAAGARLKLNNSGALSGVGFGVTKNGTGELELTNTDNTFTGAVTVAAGTLTVTKLANSGAGVTSSIGTGAATPAIALTGTLKYAGTAPAGHSTNRSITFTGAAPALDASGSGAVTYSACTQAAGARTITFTGSSTAANTLSAALSDGTGAVSVAKSGAGKWVLSNATVNYTGTTSVSEGTLNLGSTNRTLSGALSVSGGTVENSTNTISANTTMTGGTITAELTGNKTLNVNSGSAATLQPVNNANTFSGATTVAAGGILRLVTGENPTTAGAGRVLGTSAVSVSGDIKTSATGAQRGQMRYGGNLTFNTGAKLYVGGA